jgi:AAA15 family ATPase/GTPase
MIHYLKIRNFGPIAQEVEINFECAVNNDDAYEVLMPDGRRLLKLAYVYGANASGKTTVLKAFDFLRELFLKPLVNKALELEYEPFLFSELSGEPTTMELSFYCKGSRYLYEITFDRQRIIFERLSNFQSAKASRVFSRETHSDNRVSYIQFGNIIKVPAREKDLLESNTLHNNTVFGAFAKTNVDIPELEKLNKWFTAFLMPLVTAHDDLSERTAGIMKDSEEATKWISELLHKADPQVSGVELGDFEATIDDLSKDLMDNAKHRVLTGKATVTDIGINSGAFMPGFSYERKIELVHIIGNNASFNISLKKESSGTQRYFGLAGLFYLLVHGEHLLCIDELETSLHPDLMKFFLQLFLINSSRSQLLMTTHNLTLLENADFVRRDALWFSEKGETGAVDLFSAADFDSNVLRKDASISSAYRSGRLGAKPNLGSPFMN